VDTRIVLLGHVAGVHGVRGWVKIHSLTEPREAIFEYQPWLLGDAHEAVRISEGIKHGNRLIAHIEGVDDREAAEELVNRSIAVRREQLPQADDGEYYWTDLVGLEVRLQDGRVLGTVDRLVATGANDVLVVAGDRERLVPFVTGQYVKSVDLEHGVIVVDWDPDF